MRLLVVGSGASIAEAKMIESELHESLPTMKNFCKKLFQNQSIVQRTIASSFRRTNLPVVPNFVKPYNAISHEKIYPTPLDVFIQLEVQTPESHNVETFFEYAWNQFGEAHPNLWDNLIYWTIYLGLFPLFTNIFHENGIGYKKMIAGAIVCNQLTSEDIVLNLNYYVCFDLAIKQCFDKYCYAPNNEKGAIMIFKPHGSLNLFMNRERNLFMFCDPEEIPGTLTYPDSKGGDWKGTYGIVPPRFNKKYSQHPVAKTILANIQSYKPDVVTFWGVGLTNSDIDLLEIYKNACSTANKIEFINPASDAFDKAKSLLGYELEHYESINHWKERKVKIG